MGKQEREKLAAKIYKVFGSEDLPDNVVYDTSYADARMLGRFLTGRKWNQLPLEDVIRCKGDLSLFSPQGFHYYFPAFLITVLKHPHEADILVDNLIDQLGHQTWHNHNDESDELALFTTQEKDIVREFLTTYLSLFDENYWIHDNESLTTLNKALRRWTRPT